MDFEEPPPPTDTDRPGANGHDHAAKRAPGISPAQVIGTWRDQGALARIPTGLEALDRLCRGGLPEVWRVSIIGAPSAGKTALQLVIADHMARRALQTGARVGILAVDEEPEDLTVRLCQIAGFTVAEAEAREPKVLAGMAAALEPLPIRLYDMSWTIEAAAEDLAAWCAADRARGVLFVDSVQTARSDAAEGARGPRELVEGNVRALRWASTQARLLTIATSEANRASYRHGQQAEQDDLAAGAESRAIEFGAQTLLVLRTPKDEPDVVHVRVVKNRRAHKGDFFLRLDREHHTLGECEDPTAAKESVAEEERDQAQRSARANRAERDGRELARVIVANPGLGSRRLRAAAAAAGLALGHDYFDAALARLSRGLDHHRLVNQGSETRPKWFIEGTEEEQCR